MFKFLRKGLEKLGIIKPKTTVKAKQTGTHRIEVKVPVKAVARPIRRPPQVSAITNQRVVSHLTRSLPYPKLRTIRSNVNRMSAIEKEWTVEASGNDIRDMGRPQNIEDFKVRWMDAILDDPTQFDDDDYFDDGGNFRNPWWYK